MLPCGSDHIPAPVSHVAAYLLQRWILAFNFCNNFKACLAVVDICASGMDMEYIPLPVNNKMAFYTFDFLESVNTLDRLRQSASTACAVYETDCRRSVPSAFLSSIFE